MPVKILMREAKGISPFSRWLNALITAPGGNTLLLCSGYFPAPNKFYDLLDDRLLDSLKVGCSSGRIITVGYMDDYDPSKAVENQSRYNAFIARLVSEGLEVKPRKPKSSCNWHAKVAIRFAGREPLAALIGSSNLTRTSYAEGNDVYGDSWNHECDTLIYTPALSSYFDAIQRESGQHIGIMDLILNPYNESQPDEESHLSWLRDKIINTTSVYEPSRD